jgi:hypothetical protein
MDPFLRCLLLSALSALLVIATPVGLIPFENDRLSKVYRGRLDVVYLAFLKRLRANASSVAKASRSWVDQQLALYVNRCFDLKISFWLPKHAMLAGQHEYRHFMGHLFRAWGSLKSWRLQIPRSHRIPLPHDLLMYPALTAMDLAPMQAAGRCRTLFVCFRALIQVGFYDLRRPGEIANLTAGDVTFPRPYAQGPCGAVALRDPTNRASLGRAQLSTIRHQGCVRWKWFVAGLPPTAKIWALTAIAFRVFFRRVAEAANLGGLGFFPGSS